MIDNELTQRWLAALRAPEGSPSHRHQGRSALCSRVRDENDESVWAYCCLGVLAELSGDLVSATFNYRGVRNDPDYATIHDTTNLSRPVMQKVGMTSDDHFAFVRMNDDFTLTFPQIADVLEDALQFHGGDVSKTLQEVTQA